MPDVFDPPELESNAPETIDAAPSIREHLEVFSKPPVAADPSDATDAARPGETEQQAQQRRDKATGQFREGKVRHRAKSQQASPEDMDEIDALTGRLHALVGEHGNDITRKEGESDRAFKLRQRVEVMERLAKPKASEPSPSPQPTPSPAPMPAPTQTQGYAGDPEPQEDDQKYAGNYSLFLRDQAAWISRENIRQFYAYQQQQAQAQQQAQSWRQKVEKAKTKYADFEAVAFKPAAWPQGSIPDQFIREHDNGAELLYYLQSNPAEIDALSRETPLKQAERLALHLQRLASVSSEAAGTNGAAPSTQPVILPKPATPLRTEAQRPSSGPPPTDGSLSIRQHASKFKVAR